MIEDALAGQARVPHAFRRILQDALELRAQRDGDVIDADALGLRVEELEARTDRLLTGNPTHAPNRKLLAHLRSEREHLFTFLTGPGVQATNWRAEQALRPAVLNRKHWGGNKTWQGADTQQVLTSVIRTARQQQVNPVPLLVSLARQPQPAVAAQLQIPGRSPPS